MAITESSCVFVCSLSFLLIFGLPGHSAAIWSEGECRVPRRVSHRHLWRHGDQSVVQGVQDQRQQQVQSRDNTIKQLSLSKTRPTANLLHNDKCYVLYVGHSVKYNHGMINYLTVPYVQYDVTHSQGKGLCDRQTILRKQPLWRKGKLFQKFQPCHLTANRSMLMLDSCEL